MEKMKELLKNKKIIIPIIIVLILIIGGIVLGITLTKNNKEEKILETKQYTMFVKINPLVKIEFKESYYICTENKENKVCSDKTNEITNYELVNDDAKEIYKDIDLNGLSLIDALVKIYDTAKDKKIDFDTIQIVANYKFDSESLIKDVKNKSKYDVKFNIITAFNKEPIENDVIDSLENQKYYTVSFDSDGGSVVENIKVAEGYGFSKPSDPIKDGYTFVEWQLNGKKYNFEDKIANDITLKAKWVKNEKNSKKEENTTKAVEKTTSSTTKKNDNNTVNNNSTNNNSSSNNNDTGNKIDLSNSIQVSKMTKSTGLSECFFYMFATNLKTLFPEADISGDRAVYWPGETEGRQPTEISEEMLTQNINSINIDTGKENNLINILSKYKNGKYKGIANVKYSINNHRISFSYDYLVSNDKSYNIDGSVIEQEVKNALNGAIIFTGPCGGFDDYEEVTLTESLCNEFNLECSR